MESQSKEAEEEYINFIKPVIILSKIITIWPLEKNHSTSALIIRICHMIIFSFVLFSICITMTAEIIRNVDIMGEMIECVMLCIAFYLAMVRFLVYLFHQKDMRYVVETMKEDWIVSSYNDRIFLKEKCLFGFNLAKYFIAAVIVVNFTFCSVPILEIHLFGAKNILPFCGYFFISNQTVSPIFECLYAYDMVAVTLACCSVAGATSFNLIVITHGSAKFALLRRKLEAISSDDPDTNRVINDCVKRHQMAIDFADTLERIINIVALGQFIISTGLVCFAGFQIVLLLQNKVHLIKYAIFLNATIIELFIFSYSGNGLIDESEAVAESAYKSGWIGGTFSRNLQIMMIRTNIPSKITAAKFYNMSLQSFSKVLSTSFSYMMVLLTTQQE